MGYNDPAAQGILGLMSALVLRLLRSLQSLDSFGGTRADINPSVPRPMGYYNPRVHISHWTVIMKISVFGQSHSLWADSKWSAKSVPGAVC